MPRALGLEAKPPAREAFGVDAAELEVGVGHGRRAAAAAVAGGTGIGAGAVRADLDPPGASEPGGRAAAGADRDHLDHRDAQRQAAALDEAGLAVDLEAARALRAPVVD